MDYSQINSSFNAYPVNRNHNVMKVICSATLISLLAAPFLLYENYNNKNIGETTKTSLNDSKNSSFNNFGPSTFEILENKNCTELPKKDSTVLSYCKDRTTIAQGCKALGNTIIPFFEANTELKEKIWFMIQGWYEWEQAQPVAVKHLIYPYKGPQVSCFGYGCPTKESLKYISTKTMHIVEGTSTCEVDNKILKQENTTLKFKYDLKHSFPTSETDIIYYISVVGDKFSEETTNLYKELKQQDELDENGKPDFSKPSTFEHILNLLAQYKFDGIFIDHIYNQDSTVQVEILKSLKNFNHEFKRIIVATLDFKESFDGNIITFWEHPGVFENKQSVLSMINMLKNDNGTNPIILADFISDWREMNMHYPVCSTKRAELSPKDNFLECIRKDSKTTQLCNV